MTSLSIRNPGLRTLPPGVERYFVSGGGLSLIEVLPEDKLEIINDEGKQTCEIVVFNSKGKPCIFIDIIRMRFIVWHLCQSDIIFFNIFINQLVPIRVKLMFFYHGFRSWEGCN